MGASTGGGACLSAARAVENRAWPVPAVDPTRMGGGGGGGGGGGYCSDAGVGRRNSCIANSARRKMAGRKMPTSCFNRAISPSSILILSLSRALSSSPSSASFASASFCLWLSCIRCSSLAATNSRSFPRTLTSPNVSPSSGSSHTSIARLLPLSCMAFPTRVGDVCGTGSRIDGSASRPPVLNRSTAALTDDVLRGGHRDGPGAFSSASGT